VNPERRDAQPLDGRMIPGSGLENRARPQRNMRFRQTAARQMPNPSRQGLALPSRQEQAAGPDRICPPRQNGRDEGHRPRPCDRLPVIAARP